MLEPFTLPFVQRGVLEVVVLAVASGLVGTWIVLRGLSFFAHAVGTAAFPGLVLADGLGFSAHLGATGTAAAVATAVACLSRTDRERYDHHTALVLVAALAVGVVLASDVFHSGANVETLLFGSLLVVDGSDVAWAAVAAVAVLSGTLVLGHRWTATGFDAVAARTLGVHSALPDAVLLALVSLVAVATLSTIGALLATALLVVPAATTRLVCSRLPVWQAATVVLAAAEGVVGLWLSVELNAPPGAAIAVLVGVVFGAVALVRGVATALGGRRLPALAAGALALAAAVGGCGFSGGRDSGGDRVKVVATTTQLGDFARVVGGDAAMVTQILKPNTDPHDYEPRPSDVRDTADASVVLESGDDLDHWMGRVVEQAGGSPRVVDVGAHATARVPGEPTGAEASQYDPHWWHDPHNVQAVIGVIRDALTRANPGQKATYARNARAYQGRLRALDRGIRACLDRVPVARRKLVTDHDAFRYFAKRYDVRVIGAVIPSQSTQAQPNAKAVARLTALIRRQGVNALFAESSINPKLAEAVAGQSGASSDYTLYGDTLGPSGSRGGTYLGMEQANADAMVRGFTGGRKGCRFSPR